MLRIIWESGRLFNPFNEAMTETKIDPATNEERKWAAKLMAGSEPWITLKATEDQCTQACHHPEHLVFIAHRNGNAIGMIILHPRGVAGSPYIKSICVTETFRDEGIGGDLITFAERFFQPESKHIFLCVSSFNLRAQSLYEKLGYTKVGEFKDYVIEGANEVLLHKLLH
jgi:ribosomal protein S18 acetylase RimI-like enzyme